MSDPYESKLLSDMERVARAGRTSFATALGDVADAPAPVHPLLREANEKLWADDRDADDSRHQVETIRATLVVNFGKGGRKLCGIEIDHESRTTLRLMIEVLERLRSSRPPSCPLVTRRSE